MKETIVANMADGPQLYSFQKNRFFYGAYKVLTFTEHDKGRKLKVTVDTTRPICWIELWPSAYDGKDWVRWTTERALGGDQEPLARTATQAQIAPTLTWTIEPGVYTLYFVNSNSIKEPRKDIFTYHLEVLEK